MTSYPIVSDEIWCVQGARAQALLWILNLLPTSATSHRISSVLFESAALSMVVTIVACG